MTHSSHYLNLSLYNDLLSIHYSTTVIISFYLKFLKIKYTNVIIHDYQEYDV